ncbi:MAG: DUF72 domain-containing protein [Planctomycetes bacterium]|nr:DUF72 domain-containing protein [Planctomycetota bacterium]
MTKRRELHQQGLFGPLDDDAGGPERVAACVFGAGLRELADALPAGLRFGTSSWAFAGWRGLVYAADSPARQLSRHGLAAYSTHPLLTAVGVDRTFYAPIGAGDFADYAAAVPTHFRFLVKAWQALTSPTSPDGGENPQYLDAGRAIDQALAPAVEGLGDRLGPLLFQFPPQGAAVTRRPEAFAARLHAFFTRLPVGVHYAVELRDAALFCEHYVEALAAAGASHCFSVHPRLPPIARQRELVPLDGPVAVRWMLRPGLGYEQAKARYAPFDRLADPDPASRDEIAALCAAAAAAGLPVTVVVNNKAEGSAPLSVVELANAAVAKVRG